MAPHPPQPAVSRPQRLGNDQLRSRRVQAEGTAALHVKPLERHAAPGQAGAVTTRARIVHPTAAAGDRGWHRQAGCEGQLPDAPRAPPAAAALTAAAVKPVPAACSSRGCCCHRCRCRCTRSRSGACRLCCGARTPAGSALGAVALLRRPLDAYDLQVPLERRGRRLLLPRLLHQWCCLCC
jgi:hypothetical protein